MKALALMHSASPLAFDSSRSPFVSHFDITPLDIATRAKHFRLMRRLEGFGLFQGHLTITIKPVGLTAIIFGESQEVGRLECR